MIDLHALNCSICCLRVVADLQGKREGMWHAAVNEESTLKTSYKSDISWRWELPRQRRLGRVLGVWQSATLLNSPQRSHLSSERWKHSRYLVQDSRNLQVTCKLQYRLSKPTKQKGTLLGIVHIPWVLNQEPEIHYQVHTIVHYYVVYVCTTRTHSQNSGSPVSYIYL